MHTLFSLKIDLRSALNACAHIHSSLGLDLFLSDPCQETHKPYFYGGLIPKHTFLISSAHIKEDIRAFCFRDEQPTLGFISYDYGLQLKGIEHFSSNRILGHLKKYELYIEYKAQTLSILSPTKSHPQLHDIRKILMTPAGPAQPPLVQKTDITHNPSREEYIDKVKKTIAHIKQGDVYQLNLAMHLKANYKLDSKCSFQVFLSLFKEYPASHYTFFKSLNNTIVSTSPESFLKVDAGHITSTPIKGTLQTSAQTIQQDIEALSTSRKEDAELSMIVDLIRNDIAAHSKTGSIEVKPHKSIFQVDNLLQMYSEVHSEMKEDSNVIDLLLDAFPGGSITGMPKRKAMELINNLEPFNRNIYCGSCVIIKGPKDLRSSINIRTAHINHTNNIFNFFAGSGITVNSDPELEYLEILAKAQKFIQLFS